MIRGVGGGGCAGNFQNEFIFYFLPPYNFFLDGRPPKKKHNKLQKWIFRIPVHVFLDYILATLSREKIL